MQLIYHCLAAAGVPVWQQLNVDSMTVITDLRLNSHWPPQFLHCYCTERTLTDITAYTLMYDCLAADLCPGWGTDDILPQTVSSRSLQTLSSLPTFGESPATYAV